MDQISLVELVEENKIVVSYTSPKPQTRKANKNNLFTNFWRVKPYKFEVLNPLNLKVSANDFVKINIPSQKTYATLFFLFIFPLILFIVSYISITKIFPSFNMNLNALISLAFLGLGLLGFLLFSEKRKRQGVGAQPSITEVVTEKEWRIFKDCTDECSSCSLCSLGESRDDKKNN